MRTIAFVLLAACGAQPNQPVLANAPRPNPAYVAGGAAAIAGALTLADPDAASRKPEKKQDTEKKPMQVKENVSGDVLDRLDAAKADPKKPPTKIPPPNKVPSETGGALDFSTP